MRKNEMLNSALVTCRFVVSRVWRDLFHDNYFQQAAALTYTTLFSIVPLLTLLYSMLSVVPVLSGTGKEIQEFIFSNLVPSSSEVVSHYLSGFSRQARNLTVVGILFLLVTAFIMLRTADSAINRIFKTSQQRKSINNFLLYWAVLTLTPLLVGSGLVLTSYLSSFRLLDNAWIFGPTSIAGLHLLSVMIGTCIFTVVYMSVPNCKVRGSYAVVGALFVTIISFLMRDGFTLFFRVFNGYELVYGTFAFVPLFLVWVYLNWLLILLGASMVHALQQGAYEEQGNGKESMLSVLIILYYLRCCFIKGLPLTYKMLSDLLSDCHIKISITEDQWKGITRWLAGQEIILCHSGDRISLLRSSESINLSDLVRLCPWKVPDDSELERFERDDEKMPEWFLSVLNTFRQVNACQRKALDFSLQALFFREKTDS